MICEQCRTIYCSKKVCGFCRAQTALWKYQHLNNLSFAAYTKCGSNYNKFWLAYSKLKAKEHRAWNTYRQLLRSAREVHHRELLKSL